MHNKMMAIRWLTLGEAAEIAKHFPTLSQDNTFATYREAICLADSDKTSQHLAAHEAQCLTPMGRIVTRHIPSDAAHPKESG